MIGSKNLSGHWKDEPAALNKGLDKLKEQRKNFVPNGPVNTAPRYKPAVDADNGKYFTISHTHSTINMVIITRQQNVFSTHVKYYICKTLKKTNTKHIYGRTCLCYTCLYGFTISRTVYSKPS